jgi:hypothetical protein
MVTKRFNADIGFGRNPQERGYPVQAIFEINGFFLENGRSSLVSP